jgi:hypothetical protein
MVGLTATAAGATAVKGSGERWCRWPCRFRKSRNVSQINRISYILHLSSRLYDPMKRTNKTHKVYDYRKFSMRRSNNT